MFKHAIGCVLIALSAHAAEVDPASILPPALPWAGQSRALIVAQSDPWITAAEKSAFRFSPNYEETVAWLRRLDQAAPELQMVSVGKSAEGRDIWMVIASKERAFTPEAIRRSGKPLLFAHGGIHSGEIDGKDAGMMLLRDITVGGRRRELLDRASFLFIPILNVDGHERASKFGRMNQRGPEIIGWRTNARNLNLNRDYTKLETNEVRSVVSVLNQWKPDLYVDLHVTDGADYQYDITYGWNDSSGYSPSIVRWLDTSLKPAVDRELRNAGHIPGMLVFPVDNEDPRNGIGAGNSKARLSTGYGDIRNIPTVLVENHSLKPYEQRVLGTYVFLDATLKALAAAGSGLRSAAADDSRRRIDPIPLSWSETELTELEPVEFLGVESRSTLSPVSGTVRMEWLGRPVTLRVPVFRNDRLIASASRPKAWWIPATWSDIAERVRAHGVQMERVPTPRSLDVEMYRLQNPVLKNEVFEGQVMLTVSGVTALRRTERFPAGSWRVPADQPLGNLAAALLEPLSADSFLQWGYMHEILQRTEYAENYVTEPMAEQMLAADPALAEEFRKKLAADETFRADPDARLRWFYERTPFWDDRWLLYPIARER